MEPGRGFKYTAQRAIHRQNHPMTRKITTANRGSPLSKNITNYVRMSPTLRNNSRLSNQTRKILSNIRTASLQGERIPSKIRKYIRQSVKEELATPTANANARRFLFNFKRHGAHGNNK